MLGGGEDGLTSSLTSAAWHGGGGVQHVGTTGDGHVLQPHHHGPPLTNSDLTMSPHTGLHGDGSTFHCRIFSSFTPDGSLKTAEA